MRYRCPSCHSLDHLWQEVDVELTGAYQDIDEYLNPTGPVETDFADKETIGVSGVIGCSSCDWRGHRGKLEQIGIDDKPLQFIHAGQLQIGVAA